MFPAGLSWCNSVHSLWGTAQTSREFQIRKGQKQRCWCIGRFAFDTFNTQYLSVLEAQFPTCKSFPLLFNNSKNFVLILETNAKLVGTSFDIILFEMIIVQLYLTLIFCILEQNSLDYSILGGSSKISAILITYPFQVMFTCNGSSSCNTPISSCPEISNFSSVFAGHPIKITGKLTRIYFI